MSSTMDEKKRRSIFGGKKKKGTVGDEAGPSGGGVVSLFASQNVLGGKKKKEKKDKKRKLAASDAHKELIKEKMSTGDAGAQQKFKRLDSMGLIPADVLKHRVPLSQTASAALPTERRVAPMLSASAEHKDKAVPLNKPTERKDAVPVEELLERYADLAEIGSDVFRTEVRRNAQETESGVLELKGLLQQRRELQTILTQSRGGNRLDCLVRETKSKFSADPLVNDKMANFYHKDKGHFEEDLDERLKVLMKDSYRRSNALGDEFLGTHPVLVCGRRSLESQKLWAEVEGHIRKEKLRAAYQNKFKSEARKMLLEICTIALKAKVKFQQPNAAVIAQRLLNVQESEEWTATTLQDIDSLWKDVGTNEIICSLSDEKQEKYQFIITSLERILDKKYLPTPEDTFFITGLQGSARELRYRVPKGRSYQFVGISRIHQHTNSKWLHQFEFFKYFMFFADISSVEDARESYEAATKFKELRVGAAEFSHFMVFFHGEKELAKALRGGECLKSKFTTFPGGKEDPVSYVKERIAAVPANFHGQVTMHDLPLSCTFVSILESGMTAGALEMIDII
eukprot:TRINITY_DN2751_c2_g1_i1.p1 TRINITY_DN2751_c2_g1~~TRINITY_DN2751_c2_g1_i1.p1  ORF type:complete len:569 (-),score=188.98 TRINITY_DN2751_c2_g1_i1:141-1847(-)